MIQTVFTLQALLYCSCCSVTTAAASENIEVTTTKYGIQTWSQSMIINVLEETSGAPYICLDQAPLLINKLVEFM